ncbi:hypothetical protein [Candidatus Electronema sp. TJ]|uniref:hypothetical protein n=1 Tax=Candidatus Electronema sp. TJ TaxID=3401573 RepID=UPI003AA8F798
MKTVKARIVLHNDEQVEIPILIPKLDAVRKFTAELHAHGQYGKDIFLDGALKIRLSGQRSLLILK